MNKGRLLVLARELVAIANEPTPASEAGPTEVCYESLTLDLLWDRVRCNGKEAELSGNEKRVLYALMTQGGVMPRVKLLRWMFGGSSLLHSNAAGSAQRKLNTKLARLASNGVCYAVRTSGTQAQTISLVLEEATK